MKNMKKALSLLLCAALLLSCFAFTAFAEETLPESAHPYENDFTAEWDCGLPGAEGFFLTFAEDTLFEWGALTFTNIANGATETFTVPEWRDLYETDRDTYIAISVLVSAGVIQVEEKPGDVLNLYNGEELLGSFSGDELAGRTLYVPAESARLELVTDGDGAEYGFRVAGVSAAAPAGVHTVSYYYDGENPAAVSCCNEGDTATVKRIGQIVDGRACIGWSDVPGGAVKYDAGDEIAVPGDLSLYAVYGDILLAPEEAFSFGNDPAAFRVSKTTLTQNGKNLFTYSGYHMSKEDYAALLQNCGKVLALSPAMYPLAAADLALAASYPLRNWMGSCYGIAVTAALQHLGMIDMLSMQPGAETVRDLEDTPELLSFINYYQSQSMRSLVADNAAIDPSRPMYRRQLRQLVESVKTGNLVRFGFSLLNNPTPNHEILIVGAYDDAKGNHVLLTYDSNYGAEYAQGDIITTFVISPDYSSMQSDNYNSVYSFYWSDDFSGFESFRIDGSGDPTAFQKSFLARIKAFFTLLKEILLSLFGGN